MRRLLLILIGSFCLSGFAQQSITLSGEFTGQDILKVQVVDDASYLNSDPEILEDEVKNGKFKISLKITEPRMVEVRAGEDTRHFYLEPGDDLHISAKEGLTGFLAFEGSGAAHNKALQELNQRFSGDFEDSTTIREITEKSVDLFEIDRFEKLQLHKEFVKTHPERSKWSESFAKFMVDHPRYNYLSALMAYPIENANRSKFPRVVPLPQIMLDPITKEMIVNPGAMPSDKYRSFLKYFITYQGSKSNDFEKFTDMTQSLEKKFDAATEHLSGTPFLYYVASYLLENGEKCRPGAVRRIHKALEIEDANGAYSGLVQNQLADHLALADNEFAESTGPGTSAGKGMDPNDIFVLYDTNGKKVTLKDFKGKVIYVDFWASWCGPCRRQFPYAKELKSKLSKKQLKEVVFLYISMDKTEKAWKEGLEKNDIEGFQTYSPSNWSSEMAQYYRITSIPRYMLINKKGEIADPNAKRPGEEGILEDILELIGK